MENTTITPGQIVGMDVLPLQLQPDEKETSDIYHLTGGQPEIEVPNTAMLQGTVSALEGLVFQMMQLRASREAIVANDRRLSKQGVVTLSAATECMCEEMAFADPDAFATGEIGAGAFAIERLDAATTNLITKIIALLQHWARQAYLWIKSRMATRKLAERALEEVKRQLPRIESIKLRPGSFQMLRIIPAMLLSEAGIDEVVNRTPAAFDSLNNQMRDLSTATGKMFAAAAGTKSGEWRGVDSTGALVEFTKRSGMINPTGIGGRMWTIKPVVAHTYEGGDTIYKFQIEKTSITREPVEADINAGAFRAIVAALGRAMSQSALVINAVKGYADQISKTTNLLKASVSEAQESAATIMSITSCADVLTTSMAMYDAIVTNAAEDAGRALNYATMK